MLVCQVSKLVFGSLLQSQPLVELSDARLSVIPILNCTRLFLLSVFEIPPCFLKFGPRGFERRHRFLRLTRATGRTQVVVAKRLV